MRRRVRLAASAGAFGVALTLLLPVATRARADAPTLAGLSMTGTARGLQVIFGFKDYILGNVVDVGIPHAHTELFSSGEGQARAEAAQLFPGGLLAGTLREKFPGFKEANYPKSPKLTPKEPDYDADDDAYTVSGLPTTAGPITLQNSHLITHAAVDAARAQVTTQHVALDGADGPVLAITSAESFSDADASGNVIVEQARSTIRNISLIVSDSLTVKIGELQSMARSTSNGTDGDAQATFTLSDVEVIIGGQKFHATIDQDGIQLTGFAPQVPPSIPQSLSQFVDLTLKQAGIKISTPEPVEIVDGGSADASVGGLLIGFAGAVPSIFTPEVAKQVLVTVQDLEPTRPICPPDNPFTGCFTLQQICPTAAKPLCITQAIVPGGGQGFSTSLVLGSVGASAAASTPFVLGPVIPPGGTTGGTGGFPGGTTGFVTNPGTGFAQNPGLPTTPPPTTNSPRLFGLVAKMPPGALVGVGTAFLIFAVILAMGPSLLRWRSAAAR